MPKRFVEKTPRVKFLTIRNNSLTSIDGLSICQWKKINTEILQSFGYLEVFSDTNNPKLGNIDIRHLNSLKELNMDNASLTSLFIPSNVEMVSLNDNQISEIFIEPNNTLFTLSLYGNRMTSLLLEGFFDNLRSLSLRNNAIQLQSMNDLSVVEMKTKYPSIGFLFISTIDDRIAEQMILEAEENQIDLAISTCLLDDIHSLTYLRFDYFGFINFKNYNQKVYITSSVRKYFTNKVKNLIVAKANE